MDEMGQNHISTGREQKHSVYPSLHGMSADGLSKHSRLSVAASFVSLTFIILATLLPTFVLCCSCKKMAAQAPPSIQLNLSSKSGGFAEDGQATIDLFVFDNDERGLLDSYFRCKKESQVQVSSRSGKKRIVAIHDSKMDSFAWMGIDCYLTLKSTMSKLEEESVEDPVMSGETTADISGKTYCRLEFKPLMSRILLSEISMDMDFGTYRPSGLSEVKAYLTNVSSMCSIIPESVETSTSFINSGALHEQDLSGMKAAGMVFKSIGYLSNGSKTMVSHSFYCYQNCCSEEGLGTAFTRLVIEGTWDGHRYYWPIAINRYLSSAEGDGTGIKRGMSYEVKICLKHLGADSPDTDLTSSDVTLRVVAEPWEQKSAGIERF